MLPKHNYIIVCYYKILDNTTIVGICRLTYKIYYSIIFEICKNIHQTVKIDTKIYT